MKIVFVHTPMGIYPVEERQLFWRNFDIQYHAAHPGLRHLEGGLWELPHWMHWLAGVLVEEGFDSFDVLDIYSAQTVATSLDVSLVRSQVLDHPGDVYLFSPMTVNLGFAYEIAGIIKSLHPESVTVFGGVVATPLHREVASHWSVDYVIRDRAEYALPNLLRALTNRDSLVLVGNLSFVDAHGHLITNPGSYPYPTASQIPFPKIDLFSPGVGKDLRYIRIVHALGCPYQCSFCTIQTIGRRADYFGLDRVLSEIRAYRAHYGENHNIYWGDETFTLDTRRTLSLCAALKSEGNVRYDCQTRLNCLKEPSLIQALATSGCRWLEVGIETSNQDSQDIFKQGVKLRTAEETLARIRDAGIAACSFMINGFPNETADDMERSITWVCSLIQRDLLQASYLQVLVPYPGGDLYNHPDRYGIKIRHREYRYYSEDLPPVFDSTFVTSESSYKQFRDGLKLLAQAMSKKPYIGDAPDPEDLPEYGKFWADSHA